MADYGAKASLPGFDINTVVDYLQSFNSSWPLLKVGMTGVYTGIVTHNLGYPPFHLLATADGRLDQSAGLIGTYGANSAVLRQASGAGNQRYYICRLDLTQAFDAPIIAGGSIPAAVDRDYGIKVAKPGKSIRSTDMRDFALNSSARSLMVHKVRPITPVLSGASFIATVPHGLPYIPIAFAYVLPGINLLGLDIDKYYIVPPPIGVAGASYTVDATNVTVTIDATQFAPTPPVSVVVLKDPLAKTTINISYP
jgi:hypothetical protein